MRQHITKAQLNELNKEEETPVVPNSNWCLEYIDPETMPEDCLYIYN